ncbi:hypothetical protein JF544_16300 [Halobacillus kuroshimensis]|uniref:Uncharacterized protein n=1 Tax=Halobacillus kuroshimensis TaxID=302481 RepID=A0ABS3DZT2_9BACI|nr:hypothetical protein [Halobacillus kuroshimensis]MBN8236821.1 hypothetical protein [Halobacillus kuroshimensis]
MLSIIKRKTLTAITTIITAAIAYWFILPPPGRESYSTVIVVLFIGVVLGSLFSLVIEIALKKSGKSRLFLKLILHLLSGVVIQAIFMSVIENTFLLFTFVWPVVLLFICIDELLIRIKLYE